MLNAVGTDQALLSLTRPLAFFLFTAAAAQFLHELMTRPVPRCPLPCLPASPPHPDPLPITCLPSWPAVFTRHPRVDRHPGHSLLDGLSRVTPHQADSQVASCWMDSQVTPHQVDSQVTFCWTCSQDTSCWMDSRVTS